MSNEFYWYEYIKETQAGKQLTVEERKKHDVLLNILAVESGW
jgi:hypothetical protein